MKRNKLIWHLTENGCVWGREGSIHTIYFNPTVNKSTAVPRHSELDDVLCNKICKELYIPKELFGYIKIFSYLCPVEFQK